MQISDTLSVPMQDPLRCGEGQSPTNVEDPCMVGESESLMLRNVSGSARGILTTTWPFLFTLILLFRTKTGQKASEQFTSTKHDVLSQKYKFWIILSQEQRIQLTFLPLPWNWAQLHK